MKNLKMTQHVKNQITNKVGLWKVKSIDYPLNNLNNDIKSIFINRIQKKKNY